MTSLSASTFAPQFNKIWAFVQHELLYISWALMEIALFAPISFAFLPWARYWPPGQAAFWLLLVMFLPFNLVRLMSALNVPPPRQQILNAVALTLTILLSIRTLIYAPQSLWDLSWLADFFANVGESGNSLWLRDVAVFFLVVIMWQRGLRLVARQFHIEQIGFRLRLGVIVAPFAIGLNQFSLGWNMTPFILLFFLAGLMALALIRAEELEQTRSGLSASLSPRWLGLIFIAGLFVVAAAGTLAALISGESLPAVVGWLAPLLSAFAFGGLIVFSTLIYLSRPLQLLLNQFIDWLARWLQQLFAKNWLEPQIQPAPDFSDPLVTPSATDAIEIITAPSANARLIAILLMVAVVLAVSLFVRRLFRQAAFAARSGEMIDERIVDEGETPGLGQRLLQRLGLWRRWRAAASVRRIYRQMLQAAAASGYPRGESETPFEFLPTLAQMWPENTDDAQRITDAFVKVRYGELPETEAELAALTDAWKRLQETKPSSLTSTPHLEKNLAEDRSSNRR